MLKQFFKYLASNADLAHVLRKGDEQRALQLISRGQEIIAKTRYGDHTFLQLSLIYKRPSCTVELLENGADPNAQLCERPSYTVIVTSENGINAAQYQKYPDRYIQGSTIEVEIKLKKVSNIKLLMLYGAQVGEQSLELIKGHPKYNVIKKLIEDKKSQYQKIKGLQDSLNLSMPAEHQIIILRELAQLWANEATDEEDGEPIYKQHYNKKATEYEQRAIKLEELPANIPGNRIINSQELELSEKQQERASLIHKLKTH